MKSSKNYPSKTQNSSKHSKTRDKNKTLPIALLSATVTTAAFLFSAFDTRLKIQEYQVQSAKTRTPVRLAFLSDLHSCYYGKGQKKLLEKIYAQNPDIILLGGDIFDDVLPFEQAETVIAALAQRYPCYYVTGNHEYWSDDIGMILRSLESYDVTILSGTHDIISVGDTFLNICGITDPEVRQIADSYPSTYEQLESLKNVPDNGNFSVLLAHRPEYINFYLDYNYDLILSGHAHGGQWRIPGLINGLFSPQQGIFPKYAGGRYNFKEKTFLVSRGLAKETTFVPRIFNRPEIVMVNIL